VKKALFPILIIAALVIVTGVYLLSIGNPDKPLLPGGLGLNSNETNDQNEQEEEKNLFKNYGAAPEFAGIEKWLNSDPLTQEQLRDKVILVNFWTYSSINSIRTLPYLTQWYEDYKDLGFMVVGVHTPEFAFEKVSMNVESAIKKYSLTYPVALDNNYKTWTAYHNQFWPAIYLIDKEGNIVYTQFGEGKYEVTEKAIRTLLGLEGEFEIPQAEVRNQASTPEIHFGLSRLQNFGGTEKPNNGAQIFIFPPKLKANQFALEGNWEFTQEAAIHHRGFGRIKLNFNAAKVFLVAQSEKPTTIKIYVDGKLIKGVVVSNSDLYQLFDSLSGGPHTMDIEIPDENFQAFTFTFG
jgi:thiol-disulfide isomerase/thioredoxin